MNGLFITILAKESNIFFIDRKLKRIVNNLPATILTNNLIFVELI